MLTKPRWHKPGVGSLFGAAMSSATLRGPGQRQALLIGAPTFAEKGGVNVGAVYIYQFDPALKVRILLIFKRFREYVNFELSVRGLVELLLNDDNC